jgi:DNA polymerase epsilon subunit 2
VLGSAHDRSQMFRDRLELIRQRLLRNPFFSSPAVRGTSRDFQELTPIESLLGARNAVTADVVVLGMVRPSSC